MTYSGSPSSYQAQAALTATPGGLVLMLFDGALAAIAKAQFALDSDGVRDLELAHEELMRAQAILTELQVSLDHEVGGQISASLSSLYQFCIEQLIGANLSKNAASLPSVARILRELRVAFAAAEHASAA